MPQNIKQIATWWRGSNRPPLRLGRLPQKA